MSWPREISGHTVDRKQVSTPDGMAFEHWCLDCGIEVEGPDDPELRRTDCREQRTRSDFYDTL